MRRIVFGLFMLGSIFIVGCVPVVGSYYSPSGVRGVPKSEYCHGDIGAKNTMDIKFDDVELLLSANEISNSHTHLNLQIYGNPKSIRWSALSTINILNEDEHVVLHQENVSKACSAAETNYCAYSFDINSAPKDFSVTLPASLFKEQQAKDIAVKFVKKRGFWLVSLNC